MTDATLLVTAGRGPMECRRAARRVSARILAEAEECGLSIGIAEEEGSAIVSIGGDGATDLARSWTGTVLCIDRSRGRGARRNWFVGVHSLADEPPNAEVVTIDRREVVFTAMRAGGPGGQHQNTTDSAIRAFHPPSGLSAIARDGRSQHGNKELALRRIIELASVRRRLAERNLDRRNWESRIRVERGNPVRILGPVDP